MANTYTPAANSVASRVVAWLQARPSGEYNAAQIAEALKIDPKSIASSLEVALREKLVFHRQRVRGSLRAPWWYSATDREAHQRRNGFAASSTWMPAPKKDPSDTPQGDQPRSERGREVMEPEACESADGRGTTGAPALATLPQHASPGVGPMGAEQQAAERAQRMRRRKGADRPATVYQCFFCHGWHIGGKRPDTADGNKAFKRRRRDAAEREVT